MKFRCIYIYIILILSFFVLDARILKVGPGRTYSIPSDVAAIVADGDTIQIDAGEYIGDASVWYPDNLYIHGVGGYAHIRANGVYAQGKGTWVIKGNNTTVENIEFSEASVPDENGAGIRQDGGTIRIRNCYFHNNENGILGGDGGGKMIIEYCEFGYNGFGDGYTHNMYISGPDTFILRYSYSHHAKIGHNLKSRAKVNFIEYNRIMDEEQGTASYAIDIPNGGLTYIIGNLIQQGPNTDNSTIISYGAEGLSNPNSNLYMINNTVVNDRGSGNFVYVQSGAEATIQNNIFAKSGTVLSGTGNLVTNLVTNDPGLNDIANFDYRLTSNSSAINSGSNPGYGNDYNLSPIYQYVHVADKEERPLDDKIDIGAYEYSVTSLLNEKKQMLNDKIILHPNYPNPFNSSTIIIFSLSGLNSNKTKSAPLIEIYSSLGKLILSSAKLSQFGDSYKFIWNGKNFYNHSVPSGVYFVKIQKDNQFAFQKIVLIK